MIRLILLIVLQSALLAGSQIFLKMAVTSFGKFEWTLFFFKNVFTNMAFAASGVCVVIASVLWFYVIKHYELSVAYPLISISYIFGLLAAQFVFQEQVPAIRWIGVLVIMIGVFLVTKK